ncbi:Hypothetical protein CAP_5329 [Chondromyces apiculatus DSM 436]|uniref:Uncharacterized protein n=1 Tax=Chondromyces apiculatus DSM 436 TaxID=1192034 RepID=A0A017T3A6_9BACT|nr:Hypothetical protein CAP_5329 [Chondromyces apiculatus DSM 436]
MADGKPVSQRAREGTERDARVTVQPQRETSPASPWASLTLSTPASTLTGIRACARVSMTPWGDG